MGLPLTMNTPHHKPQQDADDRIEYTAADGTTKTMSRAELEARLRQQQEEGPPLVGPDGSLTKQREGKATLEEVRARVRATFLGVCGGDFGAVKCRASVCL